jgi:CHAD domain-containing protein
LKKLRYALELAVDAGEARAADLKKLKHGPDLLGRMHDLQVLIDYVRGVQASVRAEESGVRRDLDALVVTLEQSCRRLHGRFVRERAAIAAICERPLGAPQAGGAARGRQGEAKAPRARRVG